MRRGFFLLLLVVVAAALVMMPRMSRESPAARRLTWVATAQQFGPVGYRDPAGAISPDGRWIAYSEGRFVRVRPIDGGPIVALPAGDAQIRQLSWSDNDTILTDGGPGAWARYNVAAQTRDALRERPELPQPACLDTREGRREIVLPCGGAPIALEPRQLAPYGPLAVSPDRLTVYFAAPNDAGTVDLWSVAATGGRAQQLTTFSRDTYAPSVASDGTVLFKVQSYRTHVAQAPAAGGKTVALATFRSETPSFDPSGRWLGITYGTWRRLVDDANYPDIAQEAGIIGVDPGRPAAAVAQALAAGGPTMALATFRSETPSFDPTGRRLGITYGTWRRLVDDAKYPDIAQEAGIIGVDPARPAAAVAEVVDASPSEDQSLCWSPNGAWIAYHSHKDASDDIWLRPARGGPERRISFLGRGAETGWPRWSPDGKWILFGGAPARGRHSTLHVVGIDQESGRTTSEPRAIAVRGIDAELTHAEWLPDSRTVVAIAKEGPGRHVILTVPAEGGDAAVVHRVSSEHDFPGLAVSPDGANVAFVAPAPDGFFQIFRMPSRGTAAGQPVQVTSDPSHKTQPTWSPDGSHIAFTVWSYEAQFWTLR